MAIQMRRGNYDEFIPSRMTPGEWAVILSGDPIVSDGKSAFICFAAGIVKRMATYDDMVQTFDNIGADILEDMQRQLNTAVAGANSATSLANTAGREANTQANAARNAADQTNALYELIDRMLKNGELKGEKGDQGERGSDASIYTFDGLYGFTVGEDGHLYVEYKDDAEDVPDFSIGEDGHLYAEFGGE